MGVPGFYKELIKLFPFIVKDRIRNRVDYLYIDCNCLLHPQCFKILGLHPDETDQSKLFELMCSRILAFLDYLESLVKPAVLMYIAIDGIAPLAKMSQQRLRRMYEDNYKSILMRKHNIKHNSSWSNIVITPGTEFMYKLHNRIRAHYDKKSKTNRCSYAYSSYMTPGEGEHKILQHIKKHIKIGAPIVIYGLDADLIFLAMSSQYPNIYLLREADQINQDKADKDDPSKVAELMLYLDIDATKHAINLQFNGELDKFGQIHDDPFVSELKPTVIPNKASHQNNQVYRFDFINDYIFICYFLGNDFLPHLPSIDIKINGMSAVIDAYISVVQKKADTMIKIVDNKVRIDAVFLYEFIKLLADQEEYYFQSILPDHMNRMRNRRCYETEKYKIDVWYVENLFSTLDKKGNLSKLRLKDPIKLGRSDWKYRYYEHYFHTDYRQQEMIDRICENYVDGLYWVAKYYFEECPTWRWQYKYSHAPFLSDLASYLQKIVKPDTHQMSQTNIIEFDIEFDFEPQVDMYTQLVSVIPQRHSHILPSNLRCLSSSADSEVIDMYPITYPLDMAGKTILYKCLPHVPYLDIERIENAIQRAVRQTPYTKAEIERAGNICDVVWK